MSRTKPITNEEIHRRRRAASDRARRAELLLPNAVRELREALGLSRPDFSALITGSRLSARQLAEIETGKANPTARTLETIGRVFGFRLGFVPQGESVQPEAWRPRPLTDQQKIRTRALHAAALKRIRKG